MIYLDHNATTPPAPEVLQVVTDTLRDGWANASSQHALGQASKQHLGRSRATVARFLGCKPAELVFTSGATEANAMAVFGALARSGRRRLLVSAVEHAGLHAMARGLADVAVDWLPVDAQGGLRLDVVQRLFEQGGDEVALVSLMAANNETGVVMPVAEVAALAHAHGALLHVDATQWIGKLDFDFARCGADLVSLSAHKFNGPKGIGALIVRQGLALPARTVGSQERGRRGGTENLPAIAGFAAAAERLLAAGPRGAEAARIGALRDRLEQGLLAALPGTVVYGATLPRLPNTSCLRFGPLSADQVLNRFDRVGLMASSGAACASSGSEPSHVLVAMGVPRDEALGAIRLSLGDTTTGAEIDTALRLIVAELAPLLRAREADQPENNATEHNARTVAVPA